MKLNFEMTLEESIATSSQANATHVWEKSVPYLIGAMLALSSVWIGFGHFQWGQHADSLVPVLVSLQHWTPYYWEADRYGMLLPLLAVPFRHPLTNMMVQSALGIFAGLSASFLLVYYFLGQSRIWLVAAALQNIWLLTVATKAVQFDWFVANPYATSLVLGLGGVILLQKRALGIGFSLLLLAHWVNVSLLLVLIPLVVFRYLLRTDKRGVLKSVALVAISGAAGLLAKRLSHAPNTDTGFAPISTWPIAWLQICRNATKSGPADSVAHYYLLLWIVVPACVGLAFVLATRATKYALIAAASWVVTAVFFWLFVGTTVWVKLNLYSFRYIYTSMFLISMAMAVLTISPFQNAPPRWAAIAAVVATALIFVTCVFQYGMPSRSLVQRDIDRKFGNYTDDVLSSSATLISGNYWTVWPAVFDANLALYRRHDLRTIYGVGFRDSSTLGYWTGQRAICAAAPLGDPEGPYWLTNSPRHFTHVQRMNTIDLFCSQN